MTTTPERLLLISDLHLEEGRPEITDAFLDFLDTRVTGADALYILGDFFNAWIGDDLHSDLNQRISDALARLSKTGTAVFLMHGNRDFLIGRHFADQCRATLLEEPFTLEVFNRCYLLMHGDSLCTRDTEYMAFRRLVRSPAWQSEFLSKTLSQRKDFAEKARARSVSMSSNKPADIMDVTPEEVERVLLDAGCGVLIHGHTHRPAVHDVQLGDHSGKRIVLGDWDEQGWFLELSAAGEDLVSFPINS